jgi:4-diphosphocytidyl-2-C-methyl-D-erythritol kinase
MRTLTVRAYAKINLDLRVLARRPDGYHDLRTIFQSIALHDTLTLSQTAGSLAIDCDDPFVPRDRENLVWRAAAALWRLGGRGGDPRGVRVRINKRIPPQSGLGGGSSDAAAALMAFDAWWRLRTSPARMTAVAADLGADVPFFLLGGTALGLGRGEQLYPLPDLPAVHVIVLRPPFGVATAEAYRWIDQPAPIARRDQRHEEQSGQRNRSTRDRTHSRGEPATADDDRSSRRLSERPSQHLDLPPLLCGIDVANDFEPAVIARYPAVGRARAALLRAGAHVALMSGSGSAVFGLFTEPAPARAALSRLRRPGWTAILTRTVRRSVARPKWR